MRALLDAGSDVQGEGDAHKLDTIGWAACFADARRDVIDLLVARGARHHVFSAIALNDLDLVRRVVAQEHEAFRRRLAATEQEQSALHYVIAPPDGLVGGTFRTGPHYRTLALLIELGADVEATDAKGRTPLAVAMLRGDREAMRLLHAAGARSPRVSEEARPAGPPLAQSIQKLQPMLAVPDIDATLSWYREVGFELAGSHEEEGKVDWATVRFGNAEIMFVPSGRRPAVVERRGVSLWIHTNRLDDLYAALKERQLARAAVALGDEDPGIPELRFTLDLWTAFYGQREFGIVDPNGVELMFFQPLES